MVIVQARSRRKASGGLNRSTFSKRTHMIGRAPALPVIGEQRKKRVSTKGGNAKQRLMGTSAVNVYDPKAKKFSTATLKTVTENPANRNFVRRNILTKGTIVDTSAGKARITSRPGQDGIVNATLI